MREFLAVAGLIIGGILFLVALVAIPFGVIKYQTASGEHTGYVVAAESTGLLLKTNTVYVKSNPTSSQEDTYCVIDDAVFAQLQQYAASQQHVDLYYVDWLKKGIQNCNGESAIITQVRAIN